MKLVLGAGPQPIHPCHLRYIDASWQLTDLHPEPGLDQGVIKMDATKIPLEDNSVEAIYASHLLEHFPRHKTRAVLAEWHRVLKPGGEIRILVPDAFWAAYELFHGNEEVALDVFYNRDEDGIRDCHRMCFTEETLRAYFEELFELVESGVDRGDAHHVQTIFVFGRKK